MFLSMQKKNPSRIILTLHKNPCNTWLCLALDPNPAQAQVILILHSFSLMLSLIEEEGEEDIITLEVEGVAISITEEALTQTQQPSNFHNTTINTTVPHFNLLQDRLARSAIKWDTQQLTATTGWTLLFRESIHLLNLQQWLSPQMHPPQIVGFLILVPQITLHLI
jgi:hypothetical protein